MTLRPTGPVTNIRIIPLDADGNPTGPGREFRTRTVGPDGRMRPPEPPVHQLAAVLGGTLYARCGAHWDPPAWRPAPGIRSAPEPVTAAASRVTCPACLSPPSWADTGIPT